MLDGSSGKVYGFAALRRRGSASSMDMPRTSSWVLFSGLLRVCECKFSRGSVYGNGKMMQHVLLASNGYDYLMFRTVYTSRALEGLSEVVLHSGRCY